MKNRTGDRYLLTWGGYDRICEIIKETFTDSPRFRVLKMKQSSKSDGSFHIGMEANLLIGNGLDLIPGQEKE